MSKSVAVGYKEPELYKKAQTLAARLNLPLDNSHWPRLNVDTDKLTLLMPGFSPLFVDFQCKDHKGWQKSEQGRGIIRACKPTTGLRIIDATAGWGRDAAILAGSGANVCMIERNDLMAALLADGLERLDESSFLHDNLSLVHADAKDFLRNLSFKQYPDVIYMDPMHPARQKSALVKKNMQALQLLLGEDVDAMALLETALTHVKQKVVVKWPNRLKPLLPADYCIAGKTVRYDVYLRKIKSLPEG